MTMTSPHNKTGDLADGGSGFHLTPEQISWLASVGVLVAIPGLATLSDAILIHPLSILPFNVW